MNPTEWQIPCVLEICKNFNSRIEQVVDKRSEFDYTPHQAYNALCLISSLEKKGGWLWRCFKRPLKFVLGLNVPTPPVWSLIQSVENNETWLQYYKMSCDEDFVSYRSIIVSRNKVEYNTCGFNMI